MNEATASTFVWLRPSFWAAAAALSCAALFAIPTLFPSFYLFGWLAFVPFLLGLQRCRSAAHAYGFGVLTGFLASAFSTYWMAEFVHLFKAYSLASSVGLAAIYWLYCAQMFGIIAALTHYARRGNAVLWVFPTVLALAFAFYPLLFPWQIGAAQSEFLIGIQATDVTGTSGLDFVLGVVAVLIAQALIGRNVFFQRSAWAAYLLVGVWFVYGVASLRYWEGAAAHWETLNVGLVQAHEPPAIGAPDPRPGFSLGFPIEMELTEQLAHAGADLIVWPELRNTRYSTQPFVQRAYQRQFAQLATPLLFQTIEEEDRGEGVLNFNTAVLIDEHGDETGRYRKIKRIALAEYLPLFDHSATAKAWARQYLGEFFGNFSAGHTPQRFDISKASIRPFICYEVLFPHFVASADASRADIFIVQSNNGWFGNSRAAHSHMSASVLRSVENRRPLVHVMNNGLGGVVLPTGRTVLRTPYGEVAGYLLAVPYRENGITTLYAHAPYWFLSLLAVALVLILVRTHRQ